MDRLRLNTPVPPLLAVGAHLKNVVAYASGDRILLSDPLGDLETPQARDAFQDAIHDFLSEERPEAIAHDLHPNYASTLWAQKAAAGDGPAWAAPLRGLPLVGVQHHHAHLASALAEHAVEGNALGVTWDGTGAAPDARSVWGGEFLRGSAASYERVAHLRPFRLLGGEAAVREPRRTAVALLWELRGDAAFDEEDLVPVASFQPRERRLLGRLLSRGLNAPPTTSAGRLFDGVAALLGLHQQVDFEAQAAIALEKSADPNVEDALPLPVREGILDWGPLVETLIEEKRRGVDVGVLAARFHNALVNAIVDVARSIGEQTVVLTGGCFLNHWLRTRARRKLEDAGFTVKTQNRIPPGDGGISFGQIAVAAARLAGQRT